MNDTISATFGDPIGAILFLVLAALAIAIPLALFLLRRYRTAVDRLMQTHSDETPQQEPASRPSERPAARDAPLELEITDGSDPASLSASARALYHRMTVRPRRAALLYTVAGVVHAAAATVLLFWTEGFSFLPRRTFYVWLVLAWPAVLTWMAVGTASWRWKVAAPAAFAALVLLTAGEYLGRIVVLFLIYAGIPTVVLLALANRRLRAAGPLVFMVAFAAGTGALFSMDAMYWSITALDAPRVWIAQVIGLLVLAALSWLGWRGLRAIADLYAAKRLSDQLLMVSVWWLLFTIWQTLHLSLTLGGYGIAGLAPLVPFGLVLFAGHRTLRGRAFESRPPRLLLLRVFGAQRRSERLFRALTHYWRYVGSLRLIAGTDLATENMEPHEFLTFMSGQLPGQFVSGTEDLERRIQALDEEPDPDGRFRVNEFFCFEDTWRLALTRLAEESEAVLADVRGFTIERQGVVFELEQLVDTVPLQRVVLIVDDTTDRQALEETLHAAWQSRSAASPNAGGAASLTLFHLEKQRPAEVRRLLELLCRAVVS